MTKAELDRLNYQTISFKNYLTGGWALKFQACVVNNYNSYLFFVDGPRESAEQTSAIMSPTLRSSYGLNMIAINVDGGLPI